MAKKFTITDEDFIRNNYLNMTDLEIANILHRPESSISTKRKSMGLIKGRGKYIFTKEQIDNIIVMFNKGISLKEIASKFNINEYAIIDRYEEFGLCKRNNQWSKEEINLLKQVYSNESWDLILKEIPNKNKQSISNKASELGLTKDSYFWNQNDVDLVITMYKNKMSYSKIRESLNNKYTEDAIKTKLYKLNILENNDWSENELDILIKFYETDLDYVLENVARNYDSIKQKSNDLGLINPVIWKKWEDEYIKENYKIINDYEMAECLSRTRRSIKWRRNYLGLECHFYNNFGNNYISKDGSVCLSFGELEIHNYLLDINLDINKEVWYKNEFSWDNTNRRFDWVIIDHENKKWYIEYFGIYDTKRKENSMRKGYIKKTKKKVKDLYKAGVIDKCIFIFPSDLKNKTLDEIFGQYFNLDKKYKLA